MIGLDTNVLIRYIVQDDPEQSVKASAFIEENCTPDNPGYINHIVICEIFWVLKRAYKYDKEIAIDVLQQLLITREFMIENAGYVGQALHAFERSDADFSDLLIGINNSKQGCEYTITFDRKAAQSAEFQLLTS